MIKPRPSPNDQRSITKNPNNPAYEADRANRSGLGHDVPPPVPQAQPPAAHQSPPATPKR
jgi:hypothetical protein